MLLRWNRFASRKARPVLTGRADNSARLLLLLLLLLALPREGTVPSKDFLIAVYCVAGRVAEDAVALRTTDSGQDLFNGLELVVPRGLDLLNRSR